MLSVFYLAIWHLLSYLLTYLQQLSAEILHRLGDARSSGSAEADRLSVINGVTLTMDGQHAVTASLRGPPQVRNITVCPVLTLLPNPSFVHLFQKSFSL